MVRGRTAANKAAGLFRVWSTKFNEPGGLWRRDYPLTDAAKKSRAAFNPLTDTVAPGCRPKGMPTIMEQPYPMEFVRKGDAILLRLEEYDTVRTIDMAPRAKVDSLPNPSGVPQGPSSTIVERFTSTSDGRLNYTMTVTDQATFTSPLELSRSWVWRPDEIVKPYNCVEAGSLRR